MKTLESKNFFRPCELTIGQQSGSLASEYINPVARRAILDTYSEQDTQSLHENILVSHFRFSEHLHKPLLQKFTGICAKWITPWTNEEYNSNPEEASTNFLNYVIAKTDQILIRAQADGLQRIFNRKNSRTDKQGNLLNPGKNIFVGPTARVEDHPITSEGFEKLIDKICEDPLERLRLINFIQNPANSDAPSADVTELVGRIIRWLCVGEDHKTRFRPSKDNRQAFSDIIDSTDYERPMPMVGGLSGFLAKLYSTMGHDPLLFNRGPIIESFKNHFPDQLKILNDNESINTFLKLLQIASEHSPGHFTLSLNEFKIPKSLGDLTIQSTDKNKLPLTTTFLSSSVVRPKNIIISGENFPIGFALDDEPLKSSEESDSRLAKSAKDSDAAVVSGFQYAITKEEIDFYFHGLSIIAKNTPTGFEYSEPKSANSSEEIYGYTLIRQTPLTAFSINTDEAVALLSRIKTFIDKDNKSDQEARYLDILNFDERFACDLNNALSKLKASEEKLKEKKLQGEKIDAPWEDSHEDSVWLYQAAELIQHFTKVPLVRVRGLHMDVTLLDRGYQINDPDKMVKDITFSRVVAYLKSAIPNGHPRDIKDYEPLEVFATPEAVASNIHAAQAIAIKDSPFDWNSQLKTQDSLAENWWCKLNSGKTVILGIAPWFVVRHHTVSAGDTMTGVFISEACEELRDIHQKRIRASSRNTSASSDGIGEPSIYHG